MFPSPYNINLFCNLFCSLIYGVNLINNNKVCSPTTLVSNSFPFPYHTCSRQVALTFIHSNFFVLPQHFVHHFESSRAIKPRLHATSGFFWNRCIQISRALAVCKDPDAVRHSVRADAIHFFVNFDIFESLYLSQN